jgi:hypothetical protein
MNKTGKDVGERAAHLNIFFRNPYIVNELAGIDDGKHKHHTL